jgi:hypothetical protein
MDDLGSLGDSAQNAAGRKVEEMSVPAEKTVPLMHKRKV